MTKFLKADNGEILTSSNRPDKWQRGKNPNKEGGSA